MANSSGLNERPARTSSRGVTTLYQGSIGSPRDLELQPARFGHPLGSVEDLQGDQVALGIVVEDDARPLLLALRNGGVVAEDDAQRVRARVVDDSHASGTQYLAILLVRYTVTTSAGWRSTSTPTRIRYTLPSSSVRAWSTTRPGRTGTRCSGAARTWRTSRSVSPRRCNSNRACGVST